MAYIESDMLSGIYSDILSAIFSGRYSDSLSDILAGIYSDIISGILSGICSDILSGSLPDIFLTFCLAFYFTFSRACVPVQAPSTASSARCIHKSRRAASKTRQREAEDFLTRWKSRKKTCTFKIQRPSPGSPGSPGSPWSPGSCGR